ncbi:ABC transporter substrate-binding protein [Nocardioides sp. Soil805]|uniref:ABC transporter substrate-binding protein n=1 Tax=Nocardioides sp. Soil805 TaxID=1736416 RepID=UPI0007026FE7|nr:ABC transporter substrate-binding protein [Nocardioides sp. Soil805]KRF37434.1 peptide ABC transporter substrate-binding protein [Nocardioides sp. Soil805]
MKPVRKLASLAVVGALALATASCAESERGDGGEGGGDESTFTFGAAGAPEMFDPLYATDGETFRVTRQMFQGLLGIEPGSAEVIPELATEWTSNEDGTEWVFTLRDDVTFHDGEPFNADAVCANFERMFDQNEAGQVAAEYWGYVMGSFKNDPEGSLYKSCEATDEFEATVTINRSTSGFPTMLTLAALAMQSPKAMEEGNANDIAAQGEGFSFPDYAQNPVGTGPYQFVEYDQADGNVSLEAYDDYWGDAPASDKLTFRVIPDESTRRQELEAGSIDGYDLPNPADWPGLEESGNSVEVRDPFNIFYLGFNPEANPQLKDLKVRQAIYHALNREQLVQTQLPEGAEVATQFMPSTVSGYDSALEPYAYDPEQAKQLLEEAGATGMTLTFAYPTEVSRPYMPDPQQLYEALRTNLEDVGIKVDVKTASWNGGYLDNVTAGKYDAYLLGWTGDYDSAFNFIGTFFGNLKENDFGTEVMPWGKKLADDLQAADAIVDEDERATAFEDLNRQIMEEYLPGLPISHSPPALVVGPDVEGVVPSPLTAEEFSTVSVGGQ